MNSPVEVQQESEKCLKTAEDTTAVMYFWNLKHRPFHYWSWTYSLEIQCCFCWSLSYLVGVYLCEVHRSFNFCFQFWTRKLIGENKKKKKQRKKECSWKFNSSRMWKNEWRDWNVWKLSWLNSFLFCFFFVCCISLFDCFSFTFVDLGRGDNFFLTCQDLQSVTLPPLTTLEQ